MILSPDFTQQIKNLLPADEYDDFITALSDAPTTSVRRNVSKAPLFVSDFKPVLWCKNGIYLDERIPFTFDPLFHAGQYYVQDASSMIIQHIVATLTSDGEKVRYLDMCAAPGGKTTAAIDALPEGSLIVANEIMPNRVKILRENIIKWGNPNCVVTSNDAAKIGSLTDFFDIIATDVPCSGEGMFRKDDEAVNQWSPNLVAQCAALQKEIVDNIWNALRPGGYLIYSTCTYNREEDEKMVAYLIDNHGAESVDLNIPAEWNIHSAINSDYYCYRFMPHVTRGEGLFIAVLRKADGNMAAPLKVKKKKNVAFPIPKEVKSLLTDDFAFTRNGDTINAFHKSLSDDLSILSDKLNIIHHGIEVATIKGKDFIPSQCYALSACFNRNLFNIYEIDYLTAIAFLRGEVLYISDAPLGLVALSYNGIAIGFVKNLSNRANNLYPKEWRIRSSHTPDSISSLF